jgi:hypothetical protein
MSSGGERRIRTSEALRRQIYSLLPLTARESPLLGTRTIDAFRPISLASPRESVRGECKKIPTGTSLFEGLPRVSDFAHDPPARALLGAGEGIRTPDPLITNQLLYLLSYASLCEPVMLAKQTVRCNNNFSKFCHVGPRSLRCRTTSNNRTPAATETFRESTPPASGIPTNTSQCSRTNLRIPFSSPPNTRARGRE